MKLPMKATRSLTYGTRRLKAGEPFEARRQDARVLSAIGKAEYSTRMLKVADKPKPHALGHDGDGRKGGSKSGGDDMQELRAEYQEVVGKRAFPGWDAAELKRRMKEASAPE